MAKLLLRRFFGIISDTDKKDINQDASLRMNNMITNGTEFKTRKGCVKLNSSAYSGGAINLVYQFKTTEQSKSIIGCGGNLYAEG